MVFNQTLTEGFTQLGGGFDELGITLPSGIVLELLFLGFGQGLLCGCLAAFLVLIAFGIALAVVV